MTASGNKWFFGLGMARCVSPDGEELARLTLSEDGQEWSLIGTSFGWFSIAAAIDGVERRLKVEEGVEQMGTAL